jgi:hypothetical protein
MLDYGDTYVRKRAIVGSMFHFHFLWRVNSKTGIGSRNVFVDVDKNFKFQGVRNVNLLFRIYFRVKIIGSTYKTCQFRFTPRLPAKICRLVIFL